MAKRSLANRVLAFVFSMFLIIAMVKMQYRESLGVQMLYIVFEAALIGGIADWFAVTALFQKPLGVPWHTALIPRNRSRIVTAIVNTVENELISKQVIKNRMQQVRFIDMLLRWGDHQAGKRMLASMAAEAVGTILSKLSPDEMIPKLEAIVKKYLLKADVVPALKQSGQWALRSGKYNELIVFLVDAASRQVAEPETRHYLHRYLEQYAKQSTKDNFFKILFKNILESFDAINLEDAASVLQAELMGELEAMKSENHTMRIWLKNRFTTIVETLDQNSAVVTTVAEWQEVVVGRIELHEILRQMLDMVILSAQSQKLKEEQMDEDAPLNRWVQEQVERYWDRFRNNIQLQDWIEKYIKEAVAHLIETEHHLIGLITRRALDVFTEKDLNEFIESKVGEDLQWIRVNGSVVGGMVGLIIFLIQQFVYQPVLLRLGLW